MPGLPIQIAKDQINSAYTEVARRWEWASLEDALTLQTIAPVYSTSDSSTVTIVGTTVTCSANNFSTSWENPVFIRFAGEPQFYEFSAIGAVNTGTLLTAYNGDDATAIEYAVFKHIYALSSTVRELLTITYETELKPVILADLNRFDPNRDRTATWPTHYCLRGTNSSGYPLVELWPVPSDNISLTYTARVTPTALSGDSDSPLLDDNLILYTALVNSASIYQTISPENSKMIAANVAQWHTIKENIYADLIQEDVRRHTTSKAVRQSPDNLIDPNNYWQAEDITSGYP